MGAMGAPKLVAPLGEGQPRQGNERERLTAFAFGRRDCPPLLRRRLQRVEELPFLSVPDEELALVAAGGDEAAPGGHRKRVEIAARPEVLFAGAALGVVDPHGPVR